MPPYARVSAHPPDSVLVLPLQLLGGVPRLPRMCGATPSAPYARLQRAAWWAGSVWQAQQPRQMAANHHACDLAAG